jgi:hypothetical protein
MFGPGENVTGFTALAVAGSPNSDVTAANTRSLTLPLNKAGATYQRHLKN